MDDAMMNDAAPESAPRQDAAPESAPPQDAAPESAPPQDAAPDDTAPAGVTFADTALAGMRAGRRGPVEGEHLIGYDGDPTRRPGVPMHAPVSRATGAPETQPVPQPGSGERTHRAALERPTPVFGTAQPLHGLSGVLRRVAYRIPEHHARHWMILMAADRIDVMEDRAGGVMARPLEAVGAHGPAQRVRANPAPFLAGAIAGLLVARALMD
jgi:hypothetical protein